PPARPGRGPHPRRQSTRPLEPPLRPVAAQPSLAGAGPGRPRPHLLDPGVAARRRPRPCRTQAPPLPAPPPRRAHRPPRPTGHSAATTLLAVGHPARPRVRPAAHPAVALLSRPPRADDRPSRHGPCRPAH